MDPWIFSAKFLTLAYIIISFALGGRRDGTPDVIAALTFVSLTVLSRLLRPRPLKLLFLALAAALPVAAFALVNEDFMMLFPIAAAELAFELLADLRWIALPALIAAFFIGGKGLAVYTLCAGMGLMLVAQGIRLRSRVSTLEVERDRLRAESEGFRRSADRGAEYEDELARLSQLEERNRISQEIHDRVGHAMAGGIIQLEAASALMEKDREGARTMLSRSADVLREGMESIRETLRGIKPAAEQLGVRRIKTMLDGFAANGRISTRFSFDGNLSVITQPQWKVITDNVREGLTNAARHSNARSVRVSIEAMNRIVKVEIRDDGKGAYAIAKGLGLSGMEERAGAVGGKVIFDGSRGFSVITLLPIKGEGGNAD
jgi:signal transduction histidine kinase